MELDKVGSGANLVAIIGVYVGVQHYTHHHCIAIAAICALYFIASKLSELR